MFSWIPLKVNVKANCDVFLETWRMWLSRWRSFICCRPSKLEIADGAVPLSAVVYENWKTVNLSVVVHLNSRLQMELFSVYLSAVVYENSRRMDRLFLDDFALIERGAKVRKRIYLLEDNIPRSAKVPSIVGWEFIYARFTSARAFYRCQWQIAKCSSDIFFVDS